MEAVIEKRKGAYLVGGPQVGQPEYFPLEVVRGTDGALWSAWRPNDAELALIVAGEPIRVGVLGQRQVPIMVTMAEPEVA